MPTKHPYLFISKTNWTDAPRIRHQLTNLLNEKGHDVFFVQKNRFASSLQIEKKTPLLTLVRHGELLHHQLRVTPIIRSLNRRFEQNQIDQLAQQLKSKDLKILNFNYDSSYLRTCFPHNEITTLVHDDYIAGARPWVRTATEKQLAQTLNISDRALAVSYPLIKQSQDLGKECELFLPWARSTYSPPLSTPDRTEILYWGYLYENCDLATFDFLASKGIKINIIGPLSKSKKLKKLLEHPQIKYHGLGQLYDMKEVVDRCCCSIVPYSLEALNGTFKAVTLSNRGFELLAHGMPLLYANLPALLDAPKEIIRKCITAADYFAAYKVARDDFHKIQPTIQSFIAPHNKESRYLQLTTYS